MNKDLNKMLDRVELDRPFLFRDKIKTVASHYPRQGGGNSLSPNRNLQASVDRGSSSCSDSTHQEVKKTTEETYST
jgi:hypothetical protein